MATDVVILPADVARLNLSNVANADFLAKADEAGVATDTSVAAAVSVVAGNLATTQDDLTSYKTTNNAAVAAVQTNLDNYGTTTDAAIAALQESVGAASIVYSTWTELAAHPTDALVTGSQGGVLNDSGTHTDPVVGGTVANEGTYSFVTGDGWQRLSDLQSKLASDSAATAVTAAAGVRGPSNIPATGLLAMWAFDEATGDTVDNVLNPGTLDIDLTLPTDPNVTRTASGLKTAGGLIQTPSLTSARTIVALIRVGFGETTGFLISGGSSSGSAITATLVPPTENTYVGNGWGVHVPHSKPSTGQNARELNRGGWLLVFREFTQAYTTAIGFGGRHSTTTSRCTEFGIRFACAYSTTLTDDDRQAIYESVSAWASQKGVYLRKEDCPIQVDGVLVGGESTADGRSLISGLSAADQAMRYPNISIMPGNGSTNYRASEELILGLNQQTTAPTTQFGPEIGIALARRAAVGTALRGLSVGKLGKGSTYLKPSGTGLATVANTWNTAEDNVSSLFHAQWLAQIWRWEQEARLRGVGITVKLIEFLIGLNDAADPNGLSSSATYQGWLQDFYDQTLQWTGLSGVKMHLPRAHDNAANYDPTTGPLVRAAQDDLETANPTYVQTMDTDALTLEPDGVHWNAAGTKAIGAAGYVWGGL